MSKDTEPDITADRPNPVYSDGGSISVPVQLLRGDITCRLGMNELIFLIHLFAFVDARIPEFPASPGLLSECLGLTPEFIQDSLCGLEKKAFIIRVNAPEGRPDIGRRDAFDLSPLLLRMMNANGWNAPPLHVCPRCEKSVSTKEDAGRLFGFRRMRNGKTIIQSWCKTCRLGK
ncbi:hypothetical protein [Cedecea sp. NFIX57]|uniref:hypothetical protein n=1 Tax=Cedecea sp. NFIX57 TaxID=1566286 RepID=UPI000A0D402E|nr:hypothetical protein [Cedecea sp. NFIX57]SMG61773.1 hypothetical protein SAMN03159353_10594 [Cedecea sp. NFIX57]